MSTPPNTAQAPEFATSHRPRLRAAFAHPRYWPTWLVWCALGVLRWVPWRVRGWLARVLTALLVQMPTARRHDAAANLAACFPAASAAERWALLVRTVRIQIELYLAFGVLLFGRRDRLLQRFDVSGLEAVEAARAAGRGVIVLTPHTCAFEWGGQCIAMLRPVVSVARLHAEDGLMDWIMHAMRLKSGGVVYGNAQSLVPLIKAVRGGRWFFYLPDEDRRDEGGVFAPFFAEEKLTIPSIGRLASACRADVFPTRIFYHPDTQRFEVTFLPALPPFSGSDMALDAVQLNAGLESVLAPDPAQYAWFQRIFRSRPPGAQKVYGPYGALRTRRHVPRR